MRFPNYYVVKCRNMAIVPLEKFYRIVQLPQKLDNSRVNQNVYLISSGNVSQ